MHRSLFDSVVKGVISLAALLVSGCMASRTDYVPRDEPSDDVRGERFAVTVAVARDYFPVKHSGLLVFLEHSSAHVEAMSAALPHIRFKHASESVMPHRVDRFCDMKSREPGERLQLRIDEYDGQLARVTLSSCSAVLAAEVWEYRVVKRHGKWIVATKKLLIVA